MDELQRALGKIEGLLEGIAREQERVADSLTEHTAADSVNFAALSEALTRLAGSKRIAAQWGAGLGAVVAGVVEVARAIV